MIPDNLFEKFDKECRVVLRELSTEDNAGCESHWNLRPMLEVWWHNKQRLIEQLSKSPNWDAEEFRIVSKVRLANGRDVEKDLVERFRCALDRSILWNDCDMFSKLSLWISMNRHRVGTVREDGELVLSDDFTVKSTYLLGKEFKRGRATAPEIIPKGITVTDWYKLMQEYVHQSVFDVASFDTSYSQYVKPKVKTKEKEYTIMWSVNPVDFLTHAHGDRWGTCQSLNSDYNSGAALSLMQGVDTSLIFTCGNRKTNGVWYEKKKRVSLVGHPDEYLLFNRVYPSREVCGLTVVPTFAFKMMDAFSEILGTHILDDGVPLELPEHKYNYPNYNDFVNDQEDSLLMCLVNPEIDGMPLYRDGIPSPFNVRGIIAVGKKLANCHEEDTIEELYVADQLAGEHEDIESHRDYAYKMLTKKWHKEHSVLPNPSLTPTRIID